MPELIELAELVLARRPQLKQLYKGGSAIAYAVVGHMLRLRTGINEDAAFVAAKSVLERYKTC